MAIADTLALWGIVRAPEVVELAASASLDIACAATMLEKESRGGYNIWGHDPVPTANAYLPGTEVTRQAYASYAAALAEGRAGPQGVGPTQLTYPPLQRAADSIGGCWDWRCNVLTGFRHLAELHRRYGVRDGFRRYNGSGPAAEKYADDAMAKLARWRNRIGAVPASPAPRPAPAAAPAAPTSLRLGDRGPGVEKLQRFCRDVFTAYASDLVVDGVFGPKTQEVIREFQRRAKVQGSPLDGSIVGPATVAAMARYGYRP